MRNKLLTTVSVLATVAVSSQAMASVATDAMIAALNDSSFITANAADISYGLAGHQI